MKTSEQIERIHIALGSWLRDENGLLGTSIERTLEENLFARHDIMFMLDQVEETVTPEALARWVRKSQSSPSDSLIDSPPVRRVSAMEGKNVLCLHAGNLPMVGLQDILATLLSGARYHGKLSVKDPWLLDGLLRLLQNQFPEQIVMWSQNLDDLKGIRAERVLFAGSEASVDPVKKRLSELEAVVGSTRFLTRTARFSVAWLDQDDVKLLQPGSHQEEREAMLHDLTESVMRYEGRGCRSVAVVVAPCELSDIAGVLLPAFQDYVQKYPFNRSPQPGQHYWRSYLKSMDYDCFECGPVLLTNATDLLGREQVVCWIPGDLQTLEQLSGKPGSKIQNIYSIRNSSRRKFVPLSLAQQPPVDWEPDGTDVLTWLVT